MFISNTTQIPVDRPGLTFKSILYTGVILLPVCFLNSISRLNQSYKFKTFETHQSFWRRCRGLQSCYVVWKITLTHPLFKIVVQFSCKLTLNPKSTLLGCIHVLPILNLLNHCLNLSKLLTEDFADYTEEDRSNEEMKDLNTQELFIRHFSASIISDTLLNFYL